MNYRFRLNDTRIDTMKYFVPMTINFKRRSYVNKEGLSPIYLHVSCGKRRERIHLDLWTEPKLWSPNKMDFIGPAETIATKKLILDNIKSRITKIKTFYKLSDIPLTYDAFLRDFKDNLSKTDFVSFFKSMLEDRKNTIANSTYDKELAIYRKLKKFQPEIPFHEIDQQFFMRFRNFLARQDNAKTTRNGNIKVIKKYVSYAQRCGIKLAINLDEIKGGSTAGNKTYLTSFEIQKLYNYFKSEFIADNERIALGYFLFGCFTGLRFSDIMQQEKSQILQGYIYFTHVKTGKNQSVKLNKKAISLISICPELFVKKYSNDHTRKLVQGICQTLKFTKHVDFHTSRHSFGTNYILLGGQLSMLQILMNHHDPKETAVYTHLAEMEKNAEADLIDKLF